MRSQRFLIKSYQLVFGPVSSILNVPNIFPWFLHIVAPTPPYFGPLNFTHEFGVMEIQGASILRGANYVLANQR